MVIDDQEIEKGNGLLSASAKRRDVNEQTDQSLSPDTC